MKARIFSLVQAFLLAGGLLAADVARAENLNALLVYGKGFRFSVKAPVGWVGDINNASKHSANIVFYPATQTFQIAGPIIRVLIADKADENTQEDLAHDMNGYRAQYPGITFKDIAVSHPEYRVFPKLFAVPKQFYEYVAYVNPGPRGKLMFSVSMNKQKNEASAEELHAYRKVVASLQML
jgi:hypothetical protein